MNYYWIYLKEGLTHITDINGYDHILFIISISCIYTVYDFKNLVRIISTFTVAHCISLFVVTANIVNIEPSKIEIVIPLTIIISSLYNLLKFNKLDKKFHVEQSIYELMIVFVFGLIHGIGFSNYLRFILSSKESIFEPLICFNIGLELGQIVILTICLVINLVFHRFVKLYRIWVLFQLSTILLLSIYLTFIKLL